MAIWAHESLWAGLRVMGRSASNESLAMDSGERERASIASLRRGGGGVPASDLMGEGREEAGEEAEERWEGKREDERWVLLGLVELDDRSDVGPSGGTCDRLLMKLAGTELLRTSDGVDTKDGPSLPRDWNGNLGVDDPDLDPLESVAKYSCRPSSGATPNPGVILPIAIDVAAVLKSPIALAVPMDALPCAESDPLLAVLVLI